MLYKNNYANCTDNRKSWLCMKHIDVTGKYCNKVIFHENNDMIPQSIRSFCLCHFV